MGDYGFRGNNALLIESPKQGANPETANIHKKRYVVFREPSSKKRFDNDAIKELTGGGTFCARGLFESKTKKIYHLTCVVECNKKPLFKDTPEIAEIERVIDIMFRNTFVSQQSQVNHEFGVYLGDERFKTLSFQEQHKCAFLKFLMDAYRRYADSKKNLAIPESFAQRSKDYLENSSDLYQWILEKYDKTDNMDDFVYVKNIHEIFRGDEIYINLTKEERKEFIYKRFTKQISQMTFLRGRYFDKKKINNNNEYNILCGFKKKEIVVVFEEE